MNWLRELVSTDRATDELTDLLTGAGLEVEGAVCVGEVPGVVAGEILEVRPHPDADRLRVCRVALGSSTPLEIVSGAPGLEARSVVAVAPPGVELASGRRVESVELRGVRSQGVLVSEQEIGLSSYAAEVLHLPSGAKPGASVAAILGSPDTILDVAVTPNRGDCLSILGVAREVAALTGERLVDRSPVVRRRGQRGPAVEVEIRDAERCPRYSGRVIREVRVGPSPPWMRIRLESMGVRSINNVVDVTNYVLLERGQPLHAFDLREIHGGKIVVRRAGRAGGFTTLDEIGRSIDDDDLLICDAERTLALAGIMGGLDSAVRDDTHEILLESAFFAPEGIRRSARRLGLRTESSYRFERTVDVGGVVTASDRATELLAEVAGGKPMRLVDAWARRTRPARVVVRRDRINALLGTRLTAPEILRSLRRVSSRVVARRGGQYVCQPPSWRSDLGREADFVEEIARLLGYDRIPATLPRLPTVGPAPAGGWGFRERLRSILAACGLAELRSFRFASVDWNVRIPGLTPDDGRAVALRNPMSSEAGEMRRSLVPGLLSATVHNRNVGENRVAAFEVGPVFWRDPAGRVRQRDRVAAVLRDAGTNRDDGFAVVKGWAEALFEALGIEETGWLRGAGVSFLHPGTSARIRTAERDFGYLGGVHPEVASAVDLDGDVWVFELDVESLHGSVAGPRRFQPLARFPSVIRDLAVIADEPFESSRVVDVALGDPRFLVDRVRLFDVYRGDPVPAGKKSLAYAIAYRSPERTLTDEEVNHLHADLVKTLEERLGVVPRT